MTTTTGGIAAGFGGFESKKISENDTFFSKPLDSNHFVDKHTKNRNDHAIDHNKAHHSHEPSHQHHGLGHQHHGLDHKHQYGFHKKSPKEKPALHIDKKPIKGSKVLIVGHKERFLSGLDEFLNNNLKEEELESGLVNMSSSVGSSGTAQLASQPEVASAINKTNQTTTTKMNPSSLNSTNLGSIKDPQVQAAATKAKQSTLNAIEAEKNQIKALDQAQSYSDEILKNKKDANQELQKMYSFDLLDTIGRIQKSTAAEQQKQQGNK